MAVETLAARIALETAQKAMKSKTVMYFIVGVIIITLCLLITAFTFFFTFIEFTDCTSTSVSDNGINFIENQESFSSVPYRGVDYQNETIGFGHVIKPGENFTSLTLDEGNLLLREDLKTYEKSVHDEFKDVPLNQNQYDALVSLCYNLGPNIWSKINLTTDIKSYAAADVIQKDFESLDHVNGAEVAGLKNRRHREFLIFEYGDYDGTGKH